MVVIQFKNCTILETLIIIKIYQPKGSYPQKDPIPVKPTDNDTNSDKNPKAEGQRESPKDDEGKETPQTHDGCGPNCDCGKAFAQANDPASSLQKLKEDMLNILGKEGHGAVSPKELQDTLITKMNEMTQSQKMALTLEVAHDHFNGDIGKAKGHLQGVQDNLDLDKRQQGANKASNKTETESYLRQHFGDSKSPNKTFDKQAKSGKRPPPKAQTLDI